jgi:hypothetical protein
MFPRAVAILWFMCAWPLGFAQSERPSTVIVPNFKDFTIRTRRVLEDSRSSEEVLYLKGARQRIEAASKSADLEHSWEATILYQCDQRRVVTLQPEFKTCHERPLKESSESQQPKAGGPLPSSTAILNPDVTITSSSVDTGEPRTVGRFTAHHIKTEIQIESKPGAKTQSSTREVDGWYVEIPGLGCHEPGNMSGGFAWFTTAGIDRIAFKERGMGPRGYPIEETICTTESGRTNTTRIELIDSSATPLDPQLFEVPPNYSSAR